MTEKISLIPMTKELCRQYYRDFEADPSIYMDMTCFRAYEYSDERADAYYKRQIEKNRVFLAVIFCKNPVGEIIFKDIDREKKECTLSIHLQNDKYKNRGIGTQAEKLALSYAFSVLGMDAVNADAVLKNKRSQHVLEKIGFQFVNEEGIFRYYRIEKANYIRE